MARLTKIELSDILTKLPDPVPLIIDSFTESGNDDIFLCAMGFEERCLEIPRTLLAGGYRTKEAVSLLYSTNRDDNSINRPSLVSYLSDMSSSTRSLEVDDSEFSSLLRQVIESHRRNEGSRPPRVTFDISGSANRVLLRSMKVLWESEIHLRIVYTEAEQYRPTRDEYFSDPARWRSDENLGNERGVSDVSVSREHPGYHLDTLPEYLAIFPTFKAERSKAVISFVDPSLLTNPGGRVVWLLGRPHVESDAWRITAMRQINGISDGDAVYEVSTFEYKDALRTLEGIHTRNSEYYNISISPLGSKLQAIGTSLFSYMHPDVRLIFALPKEYDANNYSRGCKSSWVLDFGLTTLIRELLDNTGSLQVID